MRIPVDQLVGTMIDKYYLDQLIGQGRLSAVYMALNQAEDKRAEMLTFFRLPEECVGQARERFMVRFIQTAMHMRRLQHPYIVPLYDFGEYRGHPYIVTPLSEGESLGSLLEQQGRCDPEQAMGFLWQLAEALDYAHEQGITHGSLKPANVLLVEEAGLQTVQLAGFGLMQMLEMRGIGQVNHPYPHLFSVAGTMLANPAYLAPEVVEGNEPGVRSDIYSLATLVFEMLCGRTPFAGNDPIEIALQHVQERMPSLHSFAPDIPPALDVALQQALERDPESRLASAGSLVHSFERVMNVMQEASQPASPGQKRATQISTLPPTPHWKRVDSGSSSWQGLPGITSTRIPNVSPSFSGISKDQPQPETSLTSSQFRLQSMPNPQVLSLSPTATPSRQEVTGESSSLGQSLLDQDLLERWSMSGRLNAIQPTGGAPERIQRTWSTEPIQLQTPSTVLKSQPGKTGAQTPVRRGKPTKKGRRRVVATTSGIAVAVLLGGGLGLFYMTQCEGTGDTAIPISNPDKNVIGDGKLAKNMAVDFVNPIDKSPDILVHLPNDTFVAYDKRCTHEGVAVAYDPKTQKLICPRHNAIFDPADNGAVKGGPAPKPLPKVALHINADGTISVS